METPRPMAGPSCHSVCVCKNPSYLKRIAFLASAYSTCGMQTRPSQAARELCKLALAAQQAVQAASERIPLGFQVGHRARSCPSASVRAAKDWWQPSQHAGVLALWCGETPFERTKLEGDLLLKAIRDLDMHAGAPQADACTKPVASTQSGHLS